MSSPDEPRPEGEEERSPAIDAEIERTAQAHEEVEEAQSTGPGAEPGAADRGEIAAPGAPGELTSDDGTGTPPPAEPAEPTPAGDEDATRAPAEPGDAGVTADQPPETPDAAAKQEGAAAAAAAQEKEAEAAEAAAVGEQAERPDEAVEETEPAEVDEKRQALLDALREHLGDAVIDTAVAPGVDLWARVALDSWQEAARVCRDRLGMTSFCFLSAIDWLPSPYGRGEEATEDAGTTGSPKAAEPGVTGGDTRIQLLARLQRPGTGLGITLKADVPDDAEVPTWTGVFAGADWHERELHEMFGVAVAGHPNLAPLYLPSDFEGHPLRKDFPLLSRMVKPWPGLVDVEAMPGEPEGDEEETA